MRISRFLSFIFITCTYFFISCGSGGGGRETDPESLRVIHLAPDISAVDFEFGTDAKVEDVGYGQGTIYFEVTEGTLKLSVESETRALPLYTENLTIEADSTTTAVFTKTSDTPDFITTTDDHSEPNPGEFRIRLANFAPSESSVDAYILPEGESVDDYTADISSLAFQSFSDYLDVNQGTYQIIYTEAGSKDIVRQTNNIEFKERAVYSHFLIDDFDGGSPLSSRLFLDVQH